MQLYFTVQLSVLIEVGFSRKKDPIVLIGISYEAVCTLQLVPVWKKLMNKFSSVRFWQWAQLLNSSIFVFFAIKNNIRVNEKC